ncbi:MAG: SLC13 family permease [bacterium]
MDFLDFPNWQMWVTLFIIAVTIILYSLDRFSLEIISAMVIVTLLVLFQLFPVIDDQGTSVLDARDLLAGFASPALMAILALLIIGQAMFQSGALEYPTRYLAKAYSKWQFPAIVAIFFLVMMTSAFLNNTPVVVMFIPILTAIAAQNKIPASRFMIPLSFMSIFGGMTTIIGSSTNLLAVDAYQGITGISMGFFTLLPLGLVLASVGAIYLATLGRYLLPDRQPPDLYEGRQTDGKQYIAQIEIDRGHPLIAHGTVAGTFPDLPDMTVRMVHRREQVILPPFDSEFIFRLHDTVIVAATRKALTDLFRKKPEILAGIMSEVDVAHEEGGKGELSMVEAIVAPGSTMIGRSIAQIGFRFQTNCVILGVQRRSHMIRAQMSSIRLEAGDVLLILGDMRDLRRLRANSDILVLEWSRTGLPDANDARIATIIFAAVIALTAFGILPIAISAMLGATMMIATGCVNIRQAARSIDRRIVMLIGAALAMGLSLEQTGGADMIGHAMVALAQGGGPVLLISVFFLLTAMLTNVLSNNATAVLFTPIAISAATQSGLDPLVLVLTVIYAANCSFATPVAYQTNLLVMAPGHYKFRDYIIVGVPLIIIMWLVFTFIAPIWFRMQGLMPV